MNEDPLTFTLTHIQYLVLTLNKKNFVTSSRHLAQLVKQFGLEADRHLLRCLFSAIDFGDPAQTARNSYQAKLLLTQLNALLNKSTLISNICFAVDNCFHNQKTLKASSNLLPHIAKSLSCSQTLEVVISLALTHSKNPELVKYADQHLKNNLPSLIESYVEVDAARSNQALGFSDLTIELLHLILSILAFDRHTKLGLSDQLYGKFIELLRTEFPQKQVPLVLAPLLYTEENSELSINHLTEYSKSILTINIMDTSWPNYVMEIGYAFTVSLEECKTHLMKPGGRDITAQDVAKVIALMCRTHSKFPENNLNLPTPTLFWVSNNQQSDESGKTPGDSNSGWKSEIFVQALKEAVPNLNWKDVCIGLDHSEFVIKDRAGLQILIHTIRLGIQSSGVGQNFPAECLYRHWNNVEGQLSLITIILKNPDVYSFADHIFTSVSIDSFKTNPESENKAIGAWKSLHLIEVLLYIAEKGFIPQVSEIFKVPVQQCPDLLFMGLLQISPPLTTMRLDLMNNLIPIFLNNHPNSGALLHNAWNSQNFAQSLRPIIMLSMSEWYSRSENDQSRLSRILDVAQDLKALSSLLNVRTFMFAIDLACLASRREYLKLGKWLTDKIRENGEPFVAVIVTFLQRRLPGLYRANNKLDEPSKTVQLPPETLNTIISCLQPCANAVQQDLGECIMQIVKTCNMQLRQSQTQPNALVRSKQLPMNLMHYPEMAPPFPEQFNLNSTMNAMNLGGNISNNFNFNNMLANMESTPGSPSHMLAPPQSPFHLSSQMNPTTMNTVPRMNPTPIGGDVFGTTVKELSQNVTKEIEDEVNSYFQRIYNHPPHPTLTIDEVLDTLQNFHNSPNKRERDIFSCMLRNLFEEYRFFPQYPEKELLITAQLFGGIIERNLVGNSATLGLALKCVLDAIKKPEGSKMYFFGITALERFKTKLPSLLKFAEQIRAIPHYSEFPEQIKIYVSHAIDPTGNAAAKPMLPASLSQIISSNIQGAPTNANPGSTSGVGNLYRSSSVTGNLTTTPTSKPQASIATGNQNAVSQASRVVKSIANATNIDALLVATQSEEKVTMPPDNVQDKTAFIFNNLSQLNLPQKCDEIKELITKDYYAWLAQYMVLKRASIEFNFHVLYSNFLDALKNQEVIRLVTKETFRNIKVLLRSDKGIANFSDRSLLKNLGHWLGMMTLGRNKPILQIDIDLKSLLIEAYLKGQQELLYVVPFVAKVLEACAKSKVFKPPNPWTMAIMSVLAELHQEPDLKLNLKFEIEVLCKHLTLEIANIKPALYLKDPERARHIEFQLSQPKMQQPQTAIEEPQPRPASVAGITTSNTTNSPGPSGVGGVSDINASSWTMSTAQEPRFNYSDIQIGNIANIMPLISFPPGMNMVHAHPHLKQLIKVAFERTVTEWINPVIERSVRIAVQTTEQIIRKDFVMEPDENKMRLAAHALVRNLTAGHTLITIREQLMQSMSANLKKAFETALSPQSPEMLESAAIQLATENSELACCFMQKTAIEKALIEIDKRLVSEYEIRKLARKNHTQFFDNNVLTYQNEHMPEQIRLKVGGINPNQFATYNECAKNVPGFLPMSERDAIISLQARTPVTQEALPQNNMMVPNVQMQSHLLQLQPNSTYNSIFGLDEFNAHFDELGSKMEAFIKNASHIAQLQIQVNSMRELLETVFAARRKRDNASVITLLTKAVEGLMEGLTIIPEHVELMKLYRDIHLRIMRLLQDGRCFGAVFANRAITKCMLDCREEIRYNLEAVEILISSNYVNMPQFDLILSQLMDNGNNFMAVSFAMQLLQRYFLEERPNQLLSENDFIQTIDMLVRLVQYHRAPEGLAHMIDMLRVAQDQNLLSDRLPTGPLQFIHLGMMQARGADLNDEPPGFSDKTELLLKEWVGMYHSQGLGRGPLKTFGMFVNKMTLYGVIKTDDMITRFFRQATQLCMDLVYRTFADINIAPQLARTRIYQWIDAYVRLMALIIEHLGESGNQAMRINLLNKILGIVTGVLLQDQEMNGTSFQQIGYHRIFIMLFLELSAPEPVLENITVNVVTAFCRTYHMLRPSMAPGFCYSWLELISHRVFIGRILATIPQQKGWAMYSQLLLDLFKYLAPFLRNAELAKPVQLLYKGTLKVLLILLHDFPEFLCDYHFGFCDVIPPNCIQMRNLILSAFPRNMRLPDPFTPNLKVDLLSEISASPSIYTNYMANIQPMNFKKSLDAYLKARAPVTFLSELRSQLQISTEEGNQYNIPLMNALVLYVGTQAISHIRAKNQVPNMTTIVHSAFMDIFQNLAVDLDTEGRYSFLNAIANQLRYPNSHTHYFSCVLLYLFVEANSEAIQEQITRVLLERLIVNRPHPWGLLVTFIELIKNPVYKFWEHDFVHCAPEIEKLLESVARSCMVIKSNNQQMQNVEGELQECN